MSICLLHITPELPPTVGGVADYNVILSRRLVEASDGMVEPVLLHAGRENVENIDVDFPVTDLSGRCSPVDLAETVDHLASEAGGDTIVLLEYSGYGYAKRGAPLWLARGLRQTCNEVAVPVVTIFHELYATGPPWTSAFWMSPVQRYVAARLARMSSAVVANRKSAVPWLRRHWSEDNRLIRVQPVFSNVGEPEDLPAFRDRRPQVVVFGGEGWKGDLYRENGPFLRRLMDRGAFTQLKDMGPSGSRSPLDAAWRSVFGVLPASEVSNHLSSASLGLLSYPGSRMGKSGIAAAYASHGLPFVLFDEENPASSTAPYVEGEHFWRAASVTESFERVSPSVLQEMSRAIRGLYREYLHSRHAGRCLKQVLESVVPTDSEAGVRSI